MKKYISSSSVSFSIQVDGRERRIRFTDSTRGGSVFMCDDEKICNLIEARKDFGPVYRLDPFFADNFKEEPAEVVSEVVPPVAPETTEPVTVEDADGVTVVPEVRTLSEAKEYLKNGGVQPAAIRSKADILAVAKELMVSFPNLE
jgi:hypothetical protein